MTIDMDPASIHTIYLSQDSKFADLKQRFIAISTPHVTKEVLENLKEYYSEKIGSIRDKSRIKNLESLIRILEYRDVLRYNKIEILKHIADNCVKDAILTRHLLDYERALKNLQFLPEINHFKFGEYLRENETEFFINGEKENEAFNRVNEFNETVVQSRSKGAMNIDSPGVFKSTSRIKSLIIFALLLVGLGVISLSANYQQSAEHPGPSRSRQEQSVNFSDAPDTTIGSSTLSAPPTERPAFDVQEKVFRRISESLGKTWRDVARFVGVKESEIDEIEAKVYLGMKEKAYQALQIFKLRCDSCNWRIKLRRALEKARRKDLAELMDEILTAGDF